MRQVTQRNFDSVEEYIRKRDARTKSRAPLTDDHTATVCITCSVCGATNQAPTIKTNERKCDHV